jgi:hypothetical protein
MAGDQVVSPEMLQGALDLAAAMDKAGVKYALIGGLASGFRTHPRGTRDIDFLLQVPQVELPLLLSELALRGFEFDELKTIREWTQQHMTTLSYRGIRIDWLKPVLPIYQHVLDRAKTENWLNHPVRIASAEGLILLKLMANRPQDWVDIENLVATHGILDLDWIRSEWQSIASPDDPRMKKLEELVARQRSTPPS